MIKASFLSTVLLAWISGAFVEVNGAPYDTKLIMWGNAAPSALTPSSDTAKMFGEVVAMWNGIVAVSSKELVFDYDSSGTLGTRGRVTVFGSNYQRQFKDLGVDFKSPVMNDGYATSLALWGGTMLVGAPNDNSVDENVGKAYVYFGSNYQSVQELSADHGEQGDYFGYSVAIVHGHSYYGSGMAVVGAYGHDHDKESTVGQGCVFVYARDSTYWWEMVGKLEPQDFEHKNHGGFGYSLSAYGNTVAVGSYSAEKAFVFELEGHMHECPQGHEEEQKDDYPAECLDDRRHLRSLQGPPEEEKKWYTEWKYEHIMTVGLEEEHNPEEETSYSFGQSVALYNESSVLTLAVGAPANIGMVYVMSIMNRGDVQDNWYPEGYDHHEEDKQREEQEREQERQEREAQEEADREAREADHQRRFLQDEGDKNRFRIWNPQTNSFGYDKMGNFWILEKVLTGSNLGEQFGHSIAIDGNSLLIGNNPTTMQAGRALFYKRIFGTTSIDGNPVVSGPLYNTVWGLVTDLKDSMGMKGDHFGFSVSLYQHQAVVGSIMPNIKSDGTFGQGVAYIYDRVVMSRVAAPTAAPTPAPADFQHLMESVTDIHTVFGISFLSSSTIIGLCLVLALAYGLYYYTGGRASPRELLCGFSSTSIPSKKQIRLASMDDSGYSERSTSSGVDSRHNMSSTYSTLDNSSSHGTGSSRFAGNTRRYGGPATSVTTPPPPRMTPQVRSHGVTPPSRTAASMTSSSNPYLAHRTSS